MKCLLLILFVIILVSVLAYQLLPPSDTARRAVDELSKVHKFDLGGVGIAGSSSEGEHKFIYILSSRRSASLFREAFERGTPEARLYALCGLRLTDQTSFKRYATRFIAESRSLNCIGGCIGRDVTPIEAIAAIEQGVVEAYMNLRKKDGLDSK